MIVQVYLNVPIFSCLFALHLSCILAFKKVRPAFEMLAIASNAKLVDWFS